LRDRAQIVPQCRRSTPGAPDGYDIEVMNLLATADT
jgi:hypothetical protein